MDNEWLENFQKDLKNEGARKTFNAFMDEHYHHQGPKEKANVFAVLKRIQYPLSFFMVIAQNKVKPLENGIISINNQIEVDAAVFAELDEARQKLLLKITVEYSRGETNMKEFKSKIQTFKQSERFAFNIDKENAIKLIAKILNVNDISKVEVNLTNIFNNIAPSQALRIGKVLINLGKRGEKVVSAAQLFSIEFQIKNIAQFCCMIELIENELSGKGQAKLDHVEKLNDIESPESKMFINNLKADLTKESEINSRFKFTDSLSAVYHFRKHIYEFGKENVPENMRFYLKELPEALFGKEDYLFEKCLVQEGHLIRHVYAEGTLKCYGVLIENKFGELKVATMFKNEKFFGKTADEWEEKLTRAKLKLTDHTSSFLLN